MTGSRPSSSAASLRRRAKILAATRELLRESAAEKVLVADIAARADVSVATVYNLVGTQDHVLMAVLDQTAAEIITRVEAERAEHTGANRCLVVLSTACDVVLADPVVHRHVLGSLGQVTPGIWMDEGLYGSILESIEQAVDGGELKTELQTDTIATTIHLGFRGALMSWVFDQLGDEALRLASRRACLVPLLAAAADRQRSAILRALTDGSPLELEGSP